MSAVAGKGQDRNNLETIGEDERRSYCQMKIKPLFLSTLLSLASIRAGSIGNTPSGDADWPRWRGPYETGMARGDAPTTWSDTKNIKWKVPIPGRGHSSPVLWGDQIFITTAIPIGAEPEGGRSASSASGADGTRRGGAPGGAGPLVDHKFDLISIDRRTGKILWERTAKVAKPHEGYHRMYGSFASNSPVTDGKHVFAYFGSRGIFCYDLKGKLIWEKDLGVLMTMRLGFGEGTAPVLHENALILNIDHEGEDVMVVLDKNTGKELWRVSRDEPSNWAAPLVVEVQGRKQIVVSATRKVRSYDLKTGEVIWECAGLGTNTIPAPVRQGDMIYVMSGHREPNLLAIKLGRKGDLTGTDAVVWTNTRGNAYTASPVLHDNKLYFVTDSGMVSCLDAATGKPYYSQVRLPKATNIKSSPVGANGKLYISTEDGDVVVLKMGETFEVLATNTLEDQFFIATPAIADGEIFLRGQNTLFCIKGSGE
jgi:outer membrane protein assembly factor BamB